jgi:hypothetical protein
MTFKISKDLNPKKHPSTGHVVAYDGASPWRKKEKYSYFEVSDCQSKIRLHLTRQDNIKDFIRKLKILRKVLDRFIRHLEKHG